MARVCDAEPDAMGFHSLTERQLDLCHVTRYVRLVIKTFADKQTEQFCVTGKSRRVPSDVVRRVLRKLTTIDAAEQVELLRVPPGNRLHALGGDRAGQFSVSVNDQWRICFRFEDGDAYDVEICDYHQR
jgi:proteic killer suppression protein